MDRLMMDFATCLGVKSSGYVSVLIGDVTTNVMINRDLTVGAGDRVVVNKINGQWVAVCRVDTAAVTLPDNPSAPPPKPPVTNGSKTFTPVETRSYRTTYGWRTDNADVYHGEWGSWGNHTGCVFYGSAPRSLAGATVTSASIKVARPSDNPGQAYAATANVMRLMTNKTRPSGTVTLTSSTAGPLLKSGATTTFTIPDSWAQAMVDGTAGGLAFFDADGSPYVIFSGKGRSASAFTLTIKYTR